MIAGEEQIQQHTKCINVRSRRDRATSHLLGRGKLWRQSSPTFKREQCCSSGTVLLAEQLGNAEIQQLHLPVVSDEHIGRFDVAVDDQIGMSLGDGTEHVEEKLDTAIDVQHVVVAVFVYVFSLDVFEDEIGLSIRGDARIRQFRDVGMGELSKDSAFALEP